MAVDSTVIDYSTTGLLVLITTVYHGHRSDGRLSLTNQSGGLLMGAEAIVLLIITILLIAILLAAFTGSVCLFYRVVNTFGRIIGIRMTPGRNLIGTQVIYLGCTKAHQADIARDLQRVYDRLVGGCLDSDPAVRDKMIDLITCDSLRIGCDEEPCTRNSDRCGYTDPLDVQLGRKRIHICPSNCGGSGMSLAPAIAHELAHVARYQIHGYAAASDEQAAGKIGANCS